MDIVISICLLIVLAVATQHIVAWAGSVVHEVANTENDYAVFTFRDDRNMPMTTNIIMNICIPNVFMVFIYMISHEMNLEVIEKYLIVYIVSFYVYRLMLICIILRRKEMYSFRYEWSTAFVAITLAWFLNYYFFRSVENVFISAEELKEELWFAILVVLYQFIKQLLDKRVTQNSVLKKGQLSRYIIHKFNKFYKYYNGLMDITEKNHDMYIFLYSIMIFEDYNRGPIHRFFERIKVRLGKSATVGIMQITSDEPLTDEESILEFIKRFSDRFYGESAYLDAGEINDLAWEYNNDGDYANSVAYIYECLYQYIEEVPKYRKIFCLKEALDIVEEETKKKDEYDEEIKVIPYQQVTCNDTYSFISSLEDNSYINMEKNIYDILENVEGINNVEIAEVYDGNELIIKNISNVFIRGNASEIIVKPRYATVLTFINCHDIVLEDLKIGHTPTGECEGGVLRFENCTNIRLKNLELYGCGVWGIISQNSDLYVEGCKIHSCSEGAIELFETKCVLDKVEIFDCKDTWGSIINAYRSNIIISDTIIRDCSSENYIIEASDTAVIPCNIDIYGCEAKTGISNLEDILYK